MSGKMRGYQYDFSKNHSEMYSDEGRIKKATTMRLVLAEVFGDRLQDLQVLSVGCSTGIIDSELAGAVGSVTGIDIDADAVRFAQETYVAKNLNFKVGDAMNIDFQDASFDAIICAQVYEHVPDPVRLMSEIERVLKPGGVCYFAATNRLNLIEQHYGLPFLSIIPVSWANHYLRILGRGQFYYERHMTYGELRRLVENFDVDDVTPRLLDNPGRYAVCYMFNGPRLAAARALRRLAYWLFPGYIWLLWKRQKR